MRRPRKLREVLLDALGVAHHETSFSGVILADMLDVRLATSCWTNFAKDEGRSGDDPVFLEPFPKCGADVAALSVRTLEERFCADGSVLPANSGRYLEDCELVADPIAVYDCDSCLRRG